MYARRGMGDAASDNADLNAYIGQQVETESMPLTDTAGIMTGASLPTNPLTGQPSSSLASALNSLQSFFGGAPAASVPAASSSAALSTTTWLMLGGALVLALALGDGRRR